jgi:hypothetical protein
MFPPEMALNEAKVVTTAEAGAAIESADTAAAAASANLLIVFAMVENPLVCCIRTRRKPDAIYHAKNGPSGSVMVNHCK